MKGNLKMVLLKEKENLFGVMEKNMKVNIMILLKMDLAHFSGMIINFMKDNGLIINSMEKEKYLILEKKKKEFLDTVKL